MKKIITLILFLILMKNLPAQKIEGKYSNGFDYMEFKDDSVNFKIKSNGGLVINLRGAGTYIINDGFLLIRTGSLNGLHSYVEKSKGTKGFITFKVFDSENKPLFGVNITLTDKNNNFLFGTATNEMGQAKMVNAENAAKINFSLVGYETYSTDYSGNFNYKLYLSDYEVIENSTTVFKINLMKSDTLNLTLLSTNFPGNKTKKSDLVKLEKKARKFKYRERILTRE